MSNLYFYWNRLLLALSKLIVRGIICKSDFSRLDKEDLIREFHTLQAIFK